MNQDKLSKKCVKKLKRKGYTIATAESLTGGMVANAIVNNPGASEVFEEGFITYSDFSKIKNLGVSGDLIVEFGVASAPVAMEMAVGAMYEADVDYAVATTGVAGPDKDANGTPVGTVYIACASRNHVVVRSYSFKGNRAKVRKQATTSALKLLRHMMKKKL